MRTVPNALAGLAALAGGVSLLPAAPLAVAAQEVSRLSAFEMRRTERLISERLACLGCHRLGGEGGLVGPPLDGLAARMPADRVLAMIADPAETLPGTRMPRQPMRSDLARDVAAYLVQVTSGGTSVAPAPAPAPAGAVTGGAEPTDGAALYARHCAVCHGAEGRGDGPNATNLPVPPTSHADAALMSARPDDTLYDAIHAGGLVLDGSPRMPAFGRLLSPERIRALVRHIRALCACEGPSWSRDSGG